ncbi:MAG: TetR/AcrR family transcriptional repressor of nem operon [bacterium]|jgi:TetR/AcrR family transcriptional repressor of nem operon
MLAFLDDRSYYFFMSRPRKSEHNRKAILDKGVELFSANGYHGTGLKKILDAVQVPKGSFYHYFASKEEFAAEIIRHYSDYLLDLFDGFIKKNTESPVQTIHTAYSTMIDEFANQDCKDGCLIGNLAAEIGGSSDLCQKALQHSMNDWKKRFQSLIEKAQQLEQIRNDVTASVLTDFFWNAWEGSILRMKVESDTAPLKNNLDLMLHTLFV